jgi:RNA polymerase sigma-70 factor (ECF subfamily)
MGRAVPADSNELIQRASRGDAIAAGELLERHLPALRKYVRERISPALLAKESTSDVVQSVCRELLSGFDTFEYRGEAQFCGWLHQAALRKLVEHLRRLTASKRDGGAAFTLSAAELAELNQLEAQFASPSHEAMRREELAALEGGLARLSESDRAIIRMAHLEGLSHAEIAQHLGCREAASRKQLSRALARLARKLE